MLLCGGQRQRDTSFWEGLVYNLRKWQVLHLWFIFLLPKKRNNWKGDGNSHLGTVVRHEGWKENALGAPGFTREKM